MPLRSSTVIAKMARPTTADQCYQGVITLVADETFEIKNGEDLLEITCPVGKVWFIRVRVDVMESDA